MTGSSAQVVLITGASGEIGSYLVSHFLDRHATVLGLDKVAPRQVESLDFVFRKCDLADGPQVAEAIDELVSRFGASDVVVNCAGKIANAPLVSLVPGGWKTHDFALFDEVVASSLYAAFHVTAVSVRHLLEARKKGVIINISSICANGNPGQAAYSAAKAGLNGMTLALAKELGPMGIRVVGLAPGYFDTRSTKENVSPTRLTKVTADVPLKRLGKVPEIGAAIDFIIANDYVNGTILELNGGLVI